MVIVLTWWRYHWYDDGIGDSNYMNKGTQDHTWVLMCPRFLFVFLCSSKGFASLTFVIPPFIFMLSVGWQCLFTKKCGLDFCRLNKKNLEWWKFGEKGEADMFVHSESLKCLALAPHSDHSPADKGKLQSDLAVTRWDYQSWWELKLNQMGAPVHTISQRKQHGKHNLVK